MKLGAAVAVAVAFAAGLIVSRILLYALGVAVPRLSTQAPESVAGFYLIAGSTLLAGGLWPSARGIGGSRGIRWPALFFFIFSSFAVSVTIEASIFSSAAGILLMTPVLLLPCIMLAGLMAMLPSAAPGSPAPLGTAIGFFRARPWHEWTWRFLGAVVSFPLVYFIFGILVSPFVSAYYGRGVSGLVLPAPILILKVQFLRAVIHLASALPIILLWRQDRRRLVVALMCAFFVCVFAYDFVLAIQVPVFLVVVHGIEILADSLAYAWALVFFFCPERIQCTHPNV